MIVYTAIFGSYDNLLEPSGDYGADFVCFTDDPELKSEVWDVRVVEPTSEDSCRAAKVYKILPHHYFPNHKYSLWIDGAYKLVADPSLMVGYLNGKMMACMRHPERDCLYAEYEECLRSGFGVPEDMGKQIKKYRSEGYPENNGLIYGGFLLREHNQPQVRMVMNDWWEEICNESSRDQLSFNYVAHRCGFEWGTIPGSNLNSEFMKLIIDNTPHCRRHMLWI